MPEGPEIRREADLIADVLVGRRIERVEFGLRPLRRWIPVLQGRQLMAVAPRGKAMLLHFDSMHTLYSHNQLYGRWAVHRSGDRALPSLQVRVALHVPDAVAVLYSASEISVIPTAQLSGHPYLSKLGVELLDPATTMKVVRRQLDQVRFARRRLGDLLLDQGFLAGTGNYLRSEILFVAGLDANIRLGDLSPAAKSGLAAAALDLTRQSYCTAGITSDIAKAEAARRNGAHFEDYRFRVFAREGLACPDCAATIRRQDVTGRGWFYCPACQSGN
ncbi:MAG: endonuclease VIII [Burkholderiales bacterium]|nr:endonuclease VIII [Burkholderiales bacterium]